MYIFRITSLLTFIAVVLLLTFSHSSCLAESSAHRHLKNLPKFLTGGDISLVDWEIAQGQVYKVDGTPEAPLTIFKNAGWNFARVRLWVNPSEQGIYINDLQHDIALGKEIKDAGLILCLDIHYSDSWADPGKQVKPAAWANLPFSQLVQTVHDYTTDVVRQMIAGGAYPDIVDTGNEITAGMLWPDGQIYGPGHSFDNLAILLRAAGQGVRDGSKGSEMPLILIHIDRGTDWQGTKYFFDNLNLRNVPYDMIGLSFYPSFGGTIAGLNENLQGCAQRFKKPIIVAETSYPYQSLGPGANAALTYPMTPDGQKQYVTDLLSTIQHTPKALGRGVLWWEPEWMPINGQRGWNGQTLFDDNGNALPALAALGGVAAP